jgi:hypothetical protein
MSGSGNERGEVDREVVRELLDSGAVSFEAIGATLAKYGPRVAMLRGEDVDEENFCLTMKFFVNLYRLPRGPFTQGPVAFAPGDLAKLRELISPELRD